ncbi:MAG: hypothetical protein KIS61_16515 [Candidatus Eremiobacteraeota bacterium]|nr:hypothetical protein [Candidatus Eremiobacteraeota bacterium]
MRLTLAGLLVASATGKLWDMSGTRQAVSEFGVPPAYSNRASQILVATESAIALMLLLDPLLYLAAWLCSLLFFIFSLGVARVLIQGRTPDCHCLGQLHSVPVGPGILLRNCILVLSSLYLIRNPGYPLTASPLSTLATLLGAGCIGLASSHLALWKSVKQTAPTHLKRGQLAPHINLTAENGRQAALHSVLLPDRRNLLVFSSPKCGLCTELQPELQQWRKVLQQKVNIVLLEREVGEPEETWVEGSWRVENAALTTFKLNGTPSAVLLDEQARVVFSRPAVGPEEIVALIRTSLVE